MAPVSGSLKRFVYCAGRPTAVRRPATILRRVGSAVNKCRFYYGYAPLIISIDRAPLSVQHPQGFISGVTPFAAKTSLNNTSRLAEGRRSPTPYSVGPPMGSPGPSSFEEVYYQEVGVEDLEEYRPGGYHPVVIGDVYEGRYRVVHKLGFGGHSTVWLALDGKLSRYVALKILSAEESQSSNEGVVLRHLQDDPSTHAGKQFILLVLNQFYLEGPNGRHLCLVEEPAGYSLFTSKEDAVDSVFPIEAARSLTAQLIMGLAFMHSRGVCHGGKYTLTKILHVILLNKLRRLTSEQLPSSDTELERLNRGGDLPALW